MTGTAFMPIKRLVLTLTVLLSNCAERPDPTTRAIAAADHAGGICTAESTVFIAGFAVQTFDCEDRALRGISALVFNDQE